MKPRALLVFCLLLVPLTSRSEALSPLFKVGRPVIHTFSTEATGYGAVAEYQRKVAIYVSAKAAAEIHSGETAKVMLLPGTGSSRQLSGRVSSVLRGADPRTGQAIVSIRIPKTDIGPRSFARARIILSKRQALAVPSTAILIDQGASYVFRRGHDNQFVKTPVTLGEFNPDFAEIKTGLSQQDELLVEGVPEWAASISGTMSGD